MDLNYKVTNLFPSSVHSLGIVNFDDYKDQLIKETYQERDKDPIGGRVSNRGGWQSSLTNIRNCKSETLNDIIVSSVSKLPMSGNLSCIIEGWKNINEPGNFNVIHSHFSGNMSEQFMPIGKFDFKHSSSKNSRNGSFNFLRF